MPQSCNRLIDVILWFKPNADLLLAFQLLKTSRKSAKNTDTADIKTKGFCWYKATNGIKRHLLVDVSGNPYFVRYSKANLSDVRKQRRKIRPDKVLW